MRNAVAPMIGGAICPPFEATASMAPASCGRKPLRFISGIVTTPVERMLPTVVPLIEPKAAEARIATLAGPPRLWPSSDMARSVRKPLAPVTSSSLPKMTKTRTIVQTMRSTAPGMPLLSA